MAIRAPEPGMLAPLREPMFRRLAVGRITTYIGNAIAPVALAFAVLDLTGSVAALGLVVGARSIANVVLILMGGVLADRLPRGVILQGASLAAALSQAATALAVLLGFASIPLLLVLSVVNGAVAAVSMPAAAALTPQTVPPTLLRQANAVVRIGINAAMITGAALGGMLAALAGPGWAIAVTAVIFAVAAFFYTRVRVPRVAPSVRTAPLAELRAGWAEFTSRTWVWAIVLAFMLVNAALMGGTHVLGPAVADATIGRFAWGIVLGAQTAGALLGGILASRWQPRRALLFGTVLVTVEAIPLLTLAHAPMLIPLLAAYFLAGITIEQFTVAWDVSVQENVPPDRLARVYSYDALGSFIAIPLGEIAVGPLSAEFGTATTLTGLAGLVVLAIAGALLVPSVRALTRHEAASHGVDAPSA
ncbi:MFS transporter [Nocardia sp. NPDC051832]|uniref:MFS transporter n=1 Tax=Nocardia sp. NPDC051832 TaxID=3155673 RepID=UPI00344A466F